MLTEIHAYSLHGIPLQTGDVVCTANGAVTQGQIEQIMGEFWRMFGYVVPGEIDHCSMYVGPGSRFVEAGARGVITFEMPNGIWDAPGVNSVRWLLDTFIGVAYPVVNRGLTPADETRVRLAAANYVLSQADAAKPYNVNFFDPSGEAAFYCSQLIYRAYVDQGIDLDSNTGHPVIEKLATIVFPNEIWDLSYHVRWEPVNVGG
jgi:hypothetical protein